MTAVNDNKIKTCAVGIKAYGSAGVALGPVFHKHAILHDDVVTAADELVDIYVLGTIIEREAETDVQLITHVHP